MHTESHSKIGDFRVAVRLGTLPEPLSLNVYVQIEYTDGRLSITGVIGPLRNGNALGSCGQIQGQIERVNDYAPGWDAHAVAQLAEVWNKYHLNDLQPGCEHQIAFGWNKRKLDPDKEIGWHVDKHANLAQWACPSEHPRGVLNKPCPICGYKYGSQWLRSSVPSFVLEWLRDLPPTDKEPAWI
jgi:hypothetical protein